MSTTCLLIDYQHFGEAKIPYLVQNSDNWDDDPVSVSCTVIINNDVIKNILKPMKVYLHTFITIDFWLFFKIDNDKYLNYFITTLYNHYNTLVEIIWIVFNNWIVYFNFFFLFSFIYFNLLIIATPP